MINSQAFADVYCYLAGLERRSRVISKQEKEIIAYHEAGHALVSHYLAVRPFPCHCLSDLSAPLSVPGLGIAGYRL